MNETIELYLQKAETYLKDADLLIQNQSSESAVSRAYYAMFYVVKALLFSIDNHAHTHQGVLTQFGKHFIKTGIFEKKYGNILTKALNKRLVSDYEIGKGIDLDLATDIVKDAHEFIALIINYFQEKDQ
jgi:uncharacterized protein (UPF0332 family)